MIALILVINFGISWFNAVSCGRIWAEAKALGGFPRVMAWCGAIQSAIGFSSVIGFFIGWAAYASGHLPERFVKDAADLWYVTIIFPALGTGFIITIESWNAACRERSLSSMGIATWNTFAQIHNTYEAFEGIGDAFKGVGDLFDGLFDSKDEDSNGAALIAILIVVLALAGGAILTATLIHRYAGSQPIPAQLAMR